MRHQSIADKSQTKAYFNYCADCYLFIFSGYIIYNYIRIWEAPCMMRVEAQEKKKVNLRANLTTIRFAMMCHSTRYVHIYVSRINE